jgi:hypothetical protein
VDELSAVKFTNEVDSGSDKSVKRGMNTWTMKRRANTNYSKTVDFNCISKTKDLALTL